MHVYATIMLYSCTQYLFLYFTKNKLPIFKNYITNKLLRNRFEIKLIHFGRMEREVTKVVENIEQAEGVGARVRRSIGTNAVSLKIYFKYSMNFIKLCLLKSYAILILFYCWMFLKSRSPQVSLCIQVLTIKAYIECAFFCYRIS